MLERLETRVLVVLARDVGAQLEELGELGLHRWDRSLDVLAHALVVLLRS